MRLQLALNVDDLDEAVAFCRKAFGVDVHKRRPGCGSGHTGEPGGTTAANDEAHAPHTVTGCPWSASSRL